MVKYRDSLWPEQLRRRIGKTVWVSKIGLQFWPDITKGEFRTILSISVPAGTHNRQLEAVSFTNGTSLRMSELGTMWLAFDERPHRKDMPYRYASNLKELRDEVSAYPF